MRRFAYARLEDKTATFARLRGYFEALPAEDRDGVQDVANLRRMLEIYHALVESGLLAQAIELYYGQLSITLFYTLGAYTTMMELLTPLFPRGFAEPPTLAKTSDQRYAVSVTRSTSWRPRSMPWVNSRSIPTHDIGYVRGEYPLAEKACQKRFCGGD